MSVQLYPPSTLSFSQLTLKTLAWAEERKILENSTPFAQLAKLYEEFGELAKNYEKKANVVDDVGDMIVVLTILLHLIRPSLRITAYDIESVDSLSTSTVFPTSKETWLTLISSVGALAQLAAKSLTATPYTDDQIKQPVLQILLAFRYFAPLGTSLRDFLTNCFSHAYNEIKDREGVLTPSGVFVKQEDLPDSALPAEPAPSPSLSSSVAPQIGGSHYESLSIQPWEYFTANASFDEIKGACKQNVLKYMREKDDPKQDLMKARWYLDAWINLYTEKPS